MRITPIDFSQNLLLGAFKNPIVRVLEEARMGGNMEQTVSMLSEGTKLDYPTVESALQDQTKLALAHPTRKIGNEQAYKFNLEKGGRPLIGQTDQLQNGKRAHD